MKSDVLHISCGLYPTNGNEIHSEYFWPVLNAVSTSIPINISAFNVPYSLIFSSKTAIDFFYDKVAKNNLSILDACVSFYFVGSKSRDYFKKIFLNTHQHLYVPKTWGMQSVLHEFHLTSIKSEKMIFVTGTIGRSKQIVELSSFALEPLVLPLYKLVPYQSNFLNKIFSSPAFKDKKVVFECHSGQILAQVSAFLMEYFLCHDTFSLPKNIHFACLGQSTLDKVNELYGQCAAQRTY